MDTARVFVNRDEAGKALAALVVAHLERLGNLDPPLILALPRGGVPIALRVAEATGGELDVVVARKIGAPGQPEFGIGAIAEDGSPVFDSDTLDYLGLTESMLSRTVELERVEIQRRIRRYRGARPAPAVAGRVVIVVDDGLATGVTARAALGWVRENAPRYLILAAPVCSRQAAQGLAPEVDAVLCLQTPQWFAAVGQWYDDFRQLSDDDVVQGLAHGRGW